MKQSECLHKLIELSESLNKRAAELQQKPIEELKHRPNPEAWNTLEVIQHLNLYIEIYNQHFADSLKKAKKLAGDQELKSGYWGNKFIGMMDPTKKGMKKMKTFKSKDTKGLPLSSKVISEFIKLNQETIKLLNTAKEKDIQGVKCKLAIPLLKIKLGDAFQFLILHNQRHFMQIENTLP